jgi:hypothetical protein
MNFSRPLFTIIFRPKIVFLDTDSKKDLLNQGLPVPTYLSPHRPCLDARPLTWWLCLNHVFSP